jgi:hypothetical protein
MALSSLTIFARSNHLNEILFITRDNYVVKELNLESVSLSLVNRLKTLKNVCGPEEN